MKTRFPLLLTVAVASFTALTFQIRGDLKPAEDPNIDGPEHSTSCPGVGTCTRIVTAGDYHCVDCWWLFDTCYCDCYTGPNALLQATQSGNCVLVQIGFPPLVVTMPSCEKWVTVQTTPIYGTVCFQSP